MVLWWSVHLQNSLILASFPLTAFGTYLLARELWSNRPAAILAGLIVGFCPFRFAHAVGHLSIVSTQWIPFFFLYLERLISKPRVKSALLAGIFFGLSAGATWYYFFMTVIAAAFYVIFRINWKLPLKAFLAAVKARTYSGCGSSSFVLPFLIPYYVATHGAVVDYRGPGESQAFAAALADYVIRLQLIFDGEIRLANSGAIEQTGYGSRNGNFISAPPPCCLRSQAFFIDTVAPLGTSRDGARMSPVSLRAWNRFHSSSTS